MNIEEIRKNAPEGATDFSYIEVFDVIEYYQFAEGNKRDFLRWNGREWIIDRWFSMNSPFVSGELPTPL
ncbi:hypothetical protein KWF11_11585 [Acinetobacter pittii]|uniref:hypothetical protein n=1 Tax=Acinetobacter TaxID=469 RepID=UPI000F7D6369|nr:hypothetical protein [Acinetobacter pittii]RTA22725.1 hypothetical protein EJ483_03940 [Acinetobacter pittii]